VERSLAGALGVSATRFSIGPVDVAPNVVLAPMSGITDSVYRSIMKEENPGAVGLVVTELISIEALTRQNVRTHDMMRFRPLERPIAIQLFGADPARMAESARMAEDLGCDVIDVNCGCPAPKVTQRGGGAELMRQPDVLRDILRALRGALTIPYTVKIRAGWDEGSRNAVEVARMAEGEGVAAIAVHGRTRQQLYTGEADWELVARVKQAVRVPVIGSGDVTSAPQALARLTETGVDGIMVGRGTLSHPWIFREIDAAQRGVPIPPVTPAERFAAVDRLIARLEEELPPHAALGRARGLACRMVKHLRGGAELRAALTKAPSPTAMRELLAAAGTLVYESAA
jgi:nifR3 family TIM-barrel protein